MSNLGDAIKVSAALKKAAQEHLQEVRERVQEPDGSIHADDTLAILLALMAAEARSDASDIPRLTVAIYQLAVDAEDRRRHAHGKQGGPTAHANKTSQQRTAALLAFIRRELPSVRETHGSGPATKRGRALISRWNAHRDVKDQDWTYSASSLSFAKFCKRNGIEL
jgi:hypothetical protein